MDASAAQRALDQVFPQFSGLTAVLVWVVIPGFVFMAGRRLQWRREKREDGESVAGLMAKLTKMQSDELARLSAASEVLQKQIEMLSNARYRLQSMLDDLRDQLIAGRVMIHDYERRLGLPETRFPPIPLPTFPDVPKPS